MAHRYPHQLEPRKRDNVTQPLPAVARPRPAPLPGKEIQLLRIAIRIMTRYNDQVPGVQETNMGIARVLDHIRRQDAANATRQP